MQTNTDKASPPTVSFKVGLVESTVSLRHEAVFSECITFCEECG